MDRYRLPWRAEMIDLKAVEAELHRARAARIQAELACCDVEELAEEIRRAHLAFLRLTQGQAAAATGCANPFR
jgi:hypothetical protein